MKNIIKCGVIISSLLLAIAGQAALPGGISGHWYGHTLGQLTVHLNHDPGPAEIPNKQV